MRGGGTLHEEQDLIHAGIDQVINEAGARLRTADNSLAGFDEFLQNGESAKCDGAPVVQERSPFSAGALSHLANRVQLTLKRHLVEHF